MKLLTTNFLTCAVKACKSSPSSFPLHFKDAVLERTPVAYNPVFMANVVPRLNWDALRTTAAELGLGAALPPEPSFLDQSSAGTAPGLEPQKEEKSDARPDGEDGGEDEDGMDVEESGTAATVDRDEAAATEPDEAMLKMLHGLLLETAVSEGKLVCGNCGFEYPIKDGVGNFLLPAHLV